ncbi:MAG: arginine--tRNA ligase [Candidatus Diapherotrites archaeon]|nr:arginine--tRNA ligase [Candidatus Diapherotrites archaeon]
MNAFLEVKAYLEDLAKREGADVPIQYPPEDKLGDLALPVGFKLAKQLRIPPEEAAKRFAGKINHPLIDKVEVANGYVNVFLKRGDVSADVLKAAMDKNYGSAERGGRVVIDYSSINVAKPMHIGHLRSTVIGGSLRRIYRFLGTEAIGINYLGDIGTQFGKLIVAYKRWADEDALEREPIRELLRIYVKFHEEAEKNPSLEEEAREAYRRLEEGDEEYVRLWKRFRELTIRYAQKIYDLLGVEFDEISGESFYVEKARELAETLLKMGIAERDPETGAIIVDFGEKMGKDIILKSDGTTLYLSRDLAALLDRIERYNPDKLIYVVGSEQSDHFRKLFWLADMLGVKRGLVHVPFGLINLPEGKMSTRKGRVVFLEDVLKKATDLAGREMQKRGTYNEEDARKIGVGAVNYAILKVEPEKNITFEWSRILSFEGDTGPYLQYSTVRARKILGKAGDWTPKSAENVNDDEWKMVKLIARFPEVLEEVVQKDRPHVLARYAYELARGFHSFYDHNPVLKSEEPTRSFRLSIVSAFHNVLARSLELLLIQEPERM